MVEEREGMLLPQEQQEIKNPLEEIKSPEDKTFDWYDFLNEDGKPRFYSGIEGTNAQLGICHVDGNKVCFGLEYNNANEGNEFYEKIFDESCEEMKDFLKKLEKKAKTAGWEVVPFDHFSHKWTEEDKKRE